MKKYNSKDLHSKNHIRSVISGCSGIALICAFILVCGTGVFDKYVKNPEGISGNMNVLWMIGGLLSLTIIIVMLSNIFSSKKYEELVLNYTEEDLLEQMNNHMIYVSKSGKTSIYFTEKYLISVNNTIVPMNMLAWQFIRTTKNGPIYVLKTLDGKELSAGISGYKKHAEPCTEAIKKANPGILIGYNSDNETLYKKHKAEYKKNH